VHNQRCPRATRITRVASRPDIGRGQGIHRVQDDVNWQAGIVTGAQIVPFQCSTVARSPTAQASEEDSTLTALRPNVKLVTAPAWVRGPAAGAATAPSVTTSAALIAPLARTRARPPFRQDFASRR
jgi:hypothetical protein